MLKPDSEVIRITFQKDDSGCGVESRLERDRTTETECGCSKLGVKWWWPELRQLIECG